MLANDLAILDFATKRLAFGLEWHPIIGERADRPAWRLARQHRATHVVVSSSTSASVGLATISRSDLAVSVPIHSAAQNMAHNRANGTVVVLYQLADDRYWFAGIHEGAVIARTDCLYPSPELALDVLDDLHKAYPQIQILVNSQSLGALLAGHGTYQASSGPSLADLAGLSWSGSLLQKTHWRSTARRHLRWPFLLSMLVFAVWLAFIPLQPQKELQRIYSPSEQRNLWELAVAEQAGRTGVHGVDATHRLLRHLYALPLTIAGWVVNHIECLPQQESWVCQATLERRSPEARNSGLLSAAPAGWVIDFPSMDKARPKWLWPAISQRLDTIRLHTEAHNQRDFQSALQSIRPAFSEMILGPSQELVVESPRDDEGNPIPKPNGLPIYASRSVRFSGPLRSASLLLPHLTAVRWRKVILSINETASAGLKSSRLLLDLSGDLYELKADVSL